MGAARRLLRGGGLAVLAWSGAAFGQPGGSVAQPPPAQEAPAQKPPAAPVVTRPVLEKDEGAQYPEQAIKDKVRDVVEVVLTLEIDAQGNVQNATVDDPKGHGFDEAAVEAAKKLRFSPATRDGQPVPSKIRHKYTFTPPASRIVGSVGSQLRDTAIAGATVTIELPDGTKREVTVEADGKFRVEDLPAGTYKITAAAPGYTPQVFEESLDPGEEASVDVRLARESAPPPPPLPDVAVEEVVVRGVRPPREVTKRTLEQRELSRIPGTAGDALRAIQNLPGIARPPAIAGILIVRGAAPQETGTYVDGTFVPIIYHFGGLSSVIPTEMLEKIDFYPGNFSTYFGRHTGGVIDVGVKDPRTRPERPFHALAQADFIDARALVEGPIGKTGWNFAVAGRRSYIDVLLRPALEAADAGVTTAPVYYDYQLMLQRSWGNKHNLRLFFFGSDDRLEILIPAVNANNPGLGGNVNFGTAFYRMQARYVGKLTEDTELRMVSAVGKDALQFEVGDLYFILSSWPITSRIELSQKLGGGARNNFGIDMLYQPFTVDVRAPAPPRPGEPPAGPFGARPPLELSETDAIYRPAFYDELEITPFRGTRIVPGIRVDYTKETRTWDVQPRVNGRQDLTTGFPRTTVKGGVGRFANPPLPQETTRQFGVPHGLRSIFANHYSVGVEQEITRQLEVSSEAFYRQYDGIITPRVGNVGEGRAFGLETLLRYKPDDRFFGFVAYTLSRSVRRDTPDDPERLFNFDQTHIFTAVGSYRLGRGWEIGARFRLVSGNLRTPLSYGFYDATSGSYIPMQSYPPYSERNPMFHQLDIRIDKTWLLGNGIRVSTYLDLYNAYNQGNVEGVSYNFNHTQSVYATGIPILPSFGTRVEY